MFEGLHTCGELDGIFARWYVSVPGIFKGKPALFLDRDGVIIEEKNYLCRPEEVSFIPGVAEAIRKINQTEIPVIIVTNQSGIGRGYYGWEDFIRVQEHIYDKLEQEGARIDACIACPYHPDAKEPYKHENHYFRKPNPGMVLWPNQIVPLDLQSSWIVGDTLSDLEVGEMAGLGVKAHVMTGHGRFNYPRVIEWARDKPSVRLFETICDAIKYFQKEIFSTNRIG